MSRESREFFDQMKNGQDSGLLTRLKESGGKLWDGMTPFVEHGSHELASALFRGDGFVLYPRNTKEAQHQEGQGMDAQSKDVQAREERQIERDR